jgi:hypothetical protein
MQIVSFSNRSIAERSPIADATYPENSYPHRRRVNSRRPSQEPLLRYIRYSEYRCKPSAYWILSFCNHDMICLYFSPERNRSPARAIVGEHKVSDNSAEGVEVTIDHGGLNEFSL